MRVIGSILLDTSVVVAALRGSLRVRENLLKAEGLFLPVVSLGELEYGICRSAQAEKQKEAVASFLEGVEILSSGVETAKQYAIIKAQLAGEGTPIPENDIWIAATALEYRLPLAACDEHFLRVRGLAVLNWI